MAAISIGTALAPATSEPSVSKSSKKAARKSDLFGARFTPSDVPHIRAQRKRHPQASVSAPFEAVTIFDRPTRPVEVPNVEFPLSTRPTTPTPVHLQAPRAIAADLAPSERVTLPAVIRVPPEAVRGRVESIPELPAVPPVEAAVVKQTDANHSKRATPAPRSDRGRAVALAVGLLVGAATAAVVTRWTMAPRAVSESSRATMGEQAR